MFRKRLQLGMAVVGGVAWGCTSDPGAATRKGAAGLSPSDQAQGETLTCPLEQTGFDFTQQGSKWSNRNVSVSFAPDGTVDGTATSSLFALMDQVAPRDVWQREVARAMARWSGPSRLNVRVVSDAGTATGTAGPAQADGRFGDVRLSARDLGGYAGFTNYPQATGTAGGDLAFNTLKTYRVGQNLDVFTVVLHEFGHAIGLGHSTMGNVMYAGILGVYTELKQDDIDGVRALYGARVPDAYDGAASNDTPATASVLPVTASGATFVDADLTTVTDADHYSIRIPEGSGPVLSITALAGQSLLTPRLSLYDTAGTLLATVSAADYGQGALLQHAVAPGDVVIVGVDSPTENEFGSGAYRLAVEQRADADGLPYAAPSALAPDSRETNDALDRATSLGQTSSVTVTGLNLHWTWDEDFFAFTTARSSRTYEVSVAPGPGGGTPFEIEIYNGSGAKIASSNGASLVRFAVSSSVGYKARVFTPSRLPGAYSLTVRKIN